MKAELSQTTKEADQAEQEVLQEAASGPSAEGGFTAASAPAAPPKQTKLEMGMTIDQVMTMLGQPKSTTEFGPKKFLVYDVGKLTFVNGKLTEVN